MIKRDIGHFPNKPGLARVRPRVVNDITIYVTQLIQSEEQQSTVCRVTRDHVTGVTHVDLVV